LTRAHSIRDRYTILRSGLSKEKAVELARLPGHGINGHRCSGLIDRLGKYKTSGPGPCRAAGMRGRSLPCMSQRGVHLYPSSSSAMEYVFSGRFSLRWSLICCFFPPDVQPLESGKKAANIINRMDTVIWLHSLIIIFYSNIAPLSAELTRRTYLPRYPVSFFPASSMP